MITRLVVEQQHSLLTNPPVVVLALSSSAPHLVANNIFYFAVNRQPTPRHKMTIIIRRVVLEQVGQDNGPIPGYDSVIAIC
jgi:hypothetical protein